MFIIKILINIYLLSTSFKILLNIYLYFYRSLDYVGTLIRRMRVLANDDVYEATRHRMVAVEELHKKSW